jgi:hypothetical protein
MFLALLSEHKQSQSKVRRIIGTALKSRSTCSVTEAAINDSASSCTHKSHIVCDIDLIIQTRPEGRTFPGQTFTVWKKMIGDELQQARSHRKKKQDGGVRGCNALRPMQDKMFTWRLRSGANALNMEATSGRDGTAFVPPFIRFHLNMIHRILLQNDFEESLWTLDSASFLLSKTRLLLSHMKTTASSTQVE